MTGTRRTRSSSRTSGIVRVMSTDRAQRGRAEGSDPFAAGYLAATDRAVDAFISRDDDPAAESERWCPPHLHGDDAEQWREGFESWWEPQSSA